MAEEPTSRNEAAYLESLPPSLVVEGAPAGIRKMLAGGDVRVVGQMMVGQISVWRLDERSRWPSLPYIVLPGNVGTESTLANILRTLQGGS